MLQLSLVITITTISFDIIWLTKLSVGIYASDRRACSDRQRHLSPIHQRVEVLLVTYAEYPY